MLGRVQRVSIQNSHALLPDGLWGGTVLCDFHTLKLCGLRTNLAREDTQILLSKHSLKSRQEWTGSF